MSFEQLIELLVETMSENLIVGVFLASLAETIIPPLPTLVFLPTAGYVASQAGLGPLHAALLGVPGGAGATISAFVIYAASQKLGRAAMLRYLKRIRVGQQKVERAEAWFSRHGYKTVFFGRMVPVFRELVSIPAGLLKMAPIVFVAYTFAGSVVWCTALIMVGYYLDATVFSQWSWPDSPR